MLDYFKNRKELATFLAILVTLTAKLLIGSSNTIARFPTPEERNYTITTMIPMIRTFVHDKLQEADIKADKSSYQARLVINIAHKMATKLQADRVFKRVTKDMVEYEWADLEADIVVQTLVTLLSEMAIITLDSRHISPKDLIVKSALENTLTMLLEKMHMDFIKGKTRVIYDVLGTVMYEELNRRNLR